MEGFEYLTKISAIYDDNFSLFYYLSVYTNEYAKILIKAKKIVLREEEEPIVEKSKILLNDIGELEFDFIKYNIKNNEKLIKKLIFSKFLDFKGDYLHFMIIS